MQDNYNSYTNVSFCIYFMNLFLSIVAASFYQTIAEHNIEENQKITNSKDTTTDRLNLDRSDMLY